MDVDLSDMFDIPELPGPNGTNGMETKGSSLFFLGPGRATIRMTSRRARRQSRIVTSISYRWWKPRLK